MTAKAESNTGAEAQQPGRGMRGRTRAALMLAFLVALATRGVAAWNSGAAQPQEIRYITIARGIISGAGYVGLDNRFPDIIQPPVFPLMLAGAFLLPGNDLALARGTSILMGALLVFPGALLARRLFGGRTARRAAALIAVYPLLAHMSSAAITESTFAFLVACAALVLWRGLDHDRPRARGALFLGAGLLLGVSFLTRPEGLTYLGIACLLIVADGIVRRGSLPSILKRLSLAPLPPVGFAAMAFPYLLWVHAETGQWLLAPKAVLVTVHHNLVQEGQRENWKEPYGSLLFFEHVKFGLNQDATAIRSHEEFAAVNVGLSEGILVDEEGDVSLSDPKMAVRMVGKNLMELYLETIKYGFVLPSLLLLLAGVGLVSRPFAGEFRRSGLIVAAFFVGGFSFLLTHVQSRFLYTAMPFVLPWIAEGWRLTEAWAVASLSGGAGRGAALARRIVRTTVGVVVLGLTLVHLFPAVRITSRLWAEHRELGLSLRDEATPDLKVMAATPVVPYYAGTEFEVLPYADLAQVVRYARHKQVSHLVADRAEIPTFRPQLTSLLIPQRPHPGLELVRSLHERTSHAIFLYRVIPHDEASR